MVRQYIEDVLDTLSTEKQQKISKVMAKYGNNKWWRSDDPIEIAKNQYAELNTIMVPIDVFYDSMAKLLGRPVYNIEFRLSNKEKMDKEVKEAIELHEKGLMKMASESQVGKQITQKKIVEVLSDFEEELLRNGKSTIRATPGVTTAGDVIAEIQKREKLK